MPMLRFGRQKRTNVNNTANICEQNTLIDCTKRVILGQCANYNIDLAMLPASTYTIVKG